MIKNINNLITYQNLAYNLLTIENNNLNIYLKFKLESDIHLPQHAEFYQLNMIIENELY